MMNKNKKLVLISVLSVFFINVNAAGSAPAVKSSAPKNLEPEANITQNSNDVDRVIAVVDREVITERELQDSIQKIKQQLIELNKPVPPKDTFTRDVLQKLVDDSIMYQTAKDFGGERVSDMELDSVITNIAAQKKMTPSQFKESLEKQGQNYIKYRDALRREVIISRYRQKRIESKVTVTDAEIESFINARVKPRDPSSNSNSSPDIINLAQILVPVPQGASQAEIVDLKARAQNILDQASSKPEFLVYMTQLATADRSVKVSDLGPRSADRLPQIFVDAVKDLPAGSLVPQVIQSPAGFHIIKVVDRKGGANLASSTTSKSDSVFVTQSDINQLMITVKYGMTDDDVLRKIRVLRDQIKAKTISFEEAAKRNSDDPNVKKNNGHLGFVSPGVLPPEFEIAMSKLNIGEVSDPFKTEFGWHILQLIAKKQVEVTGAQQKEYAQAALRQQKLIQANEDLMRELRDGSTVEIRAPYSLTQ
jgi:peptidyl-prolyl cis-trans isomerase SurA